MKTIKGKVVLLDTNNMIGCLFSRKGNHGITRHTIHTVMHDNYIGHELYITSDEEIKGGNYVLTNTNNIIKMDLPHKSELKVQYDIGGRKIIATTDKSLNLPSIPQSFIDTYIEEYNKGNVIEEVEVYKDDEDPKLLISIKPTKACWSKEEVEALCRDAYTLSFEDSRQELIGGSGEDYSIGTFIKENL